MGRGRKKSDRSKSKIIHVRINEELLGSLESFCNVSNINKSEGVKLLLENVLK